MSEISFNVSNRNAITVRLEPNSVQGRDLNGRPGLYLPFQMQLLELGQQANAQYTLVRLSGKLLTQQSREFAALDVGPIAEVPSPNPYFRSQEALVLLDLRQIRQFEDARDGKDARFQLMLSGLLFYQQKFEVVRSSQYLDVVVPRSHWVDNVLSPWKIDGVKVVEIQFPATAVGENFRKAHARIEEAERLFASGQYKQTLTALRLAFEALADSLGFQGELKKCFESLFASSHPDKKEKARDALNSAYKFLHLGPHEQPSQGDPNAGPVITRHDARFALTMAYAIFEYIVPRS